MNTFGWNCRRTFKTQGRMPFFKSFDQKVSSMTINFMISAVYMSQVGMRSSSYRYTEYGSTSENNISTATEEQSSSS